MPLTLLKGRRLIVRFPDDSPYPQEKKTRQWLRASGRISPSGGHQAHLSALAYMSDSYFIGTVSRVHNLWRFASDSKATATAAAASKSPSFPKDQHPMASLEERENAGKKNGQSIGMMVSLDHTIYFHNPRAFRADEWMFTEMETPWAGDGRGLVFQRMWSKDGVLIATCVQEVSFVVFSPVNSMT